MEIIDEITATASSSWGWFTGALPNVAAAATLFKNGADGIFTDDPAAMIAEFDA